MFSSSSSIFILLNVSVDFLVTINDRERQKEGENVTGKINLKGKVGYERSKQSKIKGKKGREGKGREGKGVAIKKDETDREKEINKITKGDIFIFF